MRVLVTGSSGFIGSDLVPRLRAAGHEIVPVVRRRPGPGEISWDPSAGRLDPNDVEGADAVVHLAGVGIGSRRWNEAHKRAVLDSRVDGTRLMASVAARLDRRPRVFVSASAIGYYGHRGDEILTEESGPGTGYLAEVVKAWEASTRAAEDADIRVVRVRSGLVLHPSGGILQKTLIPFRFGVGGKLGRGDQWWSWVTLDDELSAIERALDDDSLAGAINVTAPHPVTNAEFTKILARVMRRPGIAPAPAAALRTALGAEMARELMLASQRVLPVKLQESGFKFAHEELEPALRSLLKT